MEKKKDYLLIYLVIIGVVAVFGWILLRPTPVVYYGEVRSIDRTEESIRLVFGPADSPYPERDVAINRPKEGLVGPKGIELQIRQAPDGTRLPYVDLEAMFHDLAPGDGVGFSYRDKTETELKLILFTTPTN